MIFLAFFSWCPKKTSPTSQAPSPQSPGGKTSLGVDVGWSTEEARKTKQQELKATLDKALFVGERLTRFVEGGLGGFLLDVFQTLFWG